MKKNQTKEQYKDWLEEIAKEKRNNPNHSEQAFIEILDYFDIKYTFEKPIIYNHKDGYIFDFYILIDDNEFDIEIDGISHTDEDSKLKDQKRDALAKDCNIEVIRMDSYFVLYLRNIFEDEFTKESFLKWIINGCPISFKKDMSEYKEKYERTKKELDETIKLLEITHKEFNKTLDDDNRMFQKVNKMLDVFEETMNTIEELQHKVSELEANVNKKRNNDRQRAAEDIMKDILARQKEMRFKGTNNSTSTSSNNSSTDETSNDNEELPF